MTIWKFDIDIVDIQRIFMPADARILTVQMQHGIPRLWCMVNGNNPNEERVIRIYGTGHAIDDDIVLSYIGTFQVTGGALVFHVFEQTA